MSTVSRQEVAHQWAALLFSCADHVGIIAELTNFFAERDLNISRYEEYSSDGHFFSRLEWPLDSRWEDEPAFANEFRQFADQHNASFDARFFNRPQAVGLFVSKQPHALIGILNKYEANYFPQMELSFILGDDKNLREVADRHGIPFFLVDTSGDPLEYERQQLEIVSRYKPDFLGLASYVKVISTNFLQQVDCPIINVNHSFLPAFVGAEPYKIAYERGVKLIGATSHFVTPELDQGPIIEQDVVRLRVGISLQEMIKTGQDIEQKVFSQAILRVLEHKAIVHKNKTIVFS